MYRVLFWRDGKERFTAPTHYEDAYNTAKSWDGIVVKEVADLRKINVQDKILKEMTNG